MNITLNNLFSYGDVLFANIDIREMTRTDKVALTKLKLQAATNRSDAA